MVGENISLLTGEERKLRNLYLKSLADGEIQGPPTGYPGIDKPWLKYYTHNFLRQEMPKMRIYDYMYSCSEKYSDSTALSYFGHKISYSKLYEEIKTSSKILSSIGVKDNDRVMYLMPNIPEAAFLLYGGSNIGAVSDYVDPRPDSIDVSVSARKILNLFTTEHCKHIVCFDQCYPAMIKPVENELKELGLDCIILVSASDSMNTSAFITYLEQSAHINGISSTISKLKNMNKQKEMLEDAKSGSVLKIINYSDAIKNIKYQSFEEIPYSEGKTTVITHTSGTTGTMPKPVSANHDNINSFAFQSFGSKMPFYPGDRVMHILPYFASYGVIDLVHAGLCHATTLVEIPEIQLENFGKYVYLNKAEIISGIPCWYTSMIKDNYLKRKNLGFIKYMSFGGTTMDDSDEIEINEFLNEHGCNVKLSKGHGMSEVCGCASNATDNFNEIGTMGIPLIGTSYIILNPESHEPVRFSNDSEWIYGEIAISSDAVTSCSLDGKNYGNFIVIYGEKYLLSGDLAYMNKEGVLKFDSRKDRGFSRYDGFNVKPSEIENVIKKDSHVKACIVTPFFDTEKQGNMIKANIVLTSPTHSMETKVNIVNNIINNCFISNMAVSERQLPVKYEFFDAFPLNAGGKEDYKVLSRIDRDGVVSLDLNETNISINSISLRYGNSITKIR